MKCPSCGSLDVRASKRQPAFAFIHTIQGFERYRCRACRDGFWEKSPKSDDERMRRKRQRAWGSFIQSKRRRGVIEVLLFLTMLAIFFVTIKYLVSKTEGPSQSPAGLLLVPPPPGR